MLSIGISFLVLFAALWLLERKKRELDAFIIAVVVIAPVLVLFLFWFVMALLVAEGDDGGWAAAGIAGFLIYLATTVGALWRFLDLPIGRALAYGALVVVVNVLVGLVLVGI